MVQMYLEYLIGYGMAGEFGRFRASAPLALSRGQRVVIRGERGLEVGQVLRPASERLARWLPNTSVGSLIRMLTSEDEAQHRRMCWRADQLLRRGAQLIEELGLYIALLDAEVLLDGCHAVLHHVKWQECDVRELVRPLSSEFDLTISLADMGMPPLPEKEEDHGCGSCGEGGGCGSCGSGGCGSCGDSEPVDLREHFAALREKMEQRRVPLL